MGGLGHHWRQADNAWSHGRRIMRQSQGSTPCNGVQPDSAGREKCMSVRLSVLLAMLLLPGCDKPASAPPQNAASSAQEPSPRQKATWHAHALAGRDGITISPCAQDSISGFESRHFTLPRQARQWCARCPSCDVQFV